MDVQLLAAWGEFVGGVAGLVAAIGVIITLLYLARQIRQSSQTTRSAAMDSWVSDYNSLLLEQCKDAEFSVVYRNALARFSELPPNDQYRFHLFMSAHLLNAQTMYFQLQDGTFDRQIADQILPFNASLLKTPGGLQWWQGAREVWRPLFVQHMDGLIENAQPVTEVWPWFNSDEADMRVN